MVKAAALAGEVTHVRIARRVAMALAPVVALLIAGGANWKVA